MTPAIRELVYAFKDTVNQLANQPHLTQAEEAHIKQAAVELDSAAMWEELKSEGIKDS